MDYSIGSLIIPYENVDLKNNEVKFSFSALYNHEEFLDIFNYAFFTHTQGPFVQIDKLMESLANMDMEEETQNGETNFSSGEMS